MLDGASLGCGVFGGGVRSVGGGGGLVGPLVGAVGGGDGGRAVGAQVPHSTGHMLRM